MALADDLVAAATREIQSHTSYGRPGQTCACDEHPATLAGHQARKAAASTIRALVASGDYPTDRRSLLELADDVEHWPATAPDLLQVARDAMHRDPTTTGVVAAVSTVVQVAGEQNQTKETT